MFSTLKEEKKLWQKGFKRIAGLDEAGRGPLAGPVVAAVVMVKISNFLRRSPADSSRGCPSASKRFPNFKIKIPKELRTVRDSKKLTAKKREKLYKILIKSPFIEWAIGKVSEKVIDKINILEATKLAMKKAINKLKTKPDFLILDGNFKINSSISQKSIIKADGSVFSCSAASILAKVWRDRLMKRYHKKYPQYDFLKHKGYPTKLHIKMLKKHGSCEIHRKTFWPVIKYKNIARRHRICYPII